MTTILVTSIFKKDTVLFAFLWCAVHPRQCSSNTTEKLSNKDRRISQLNTFEEVLLEQQKCLLIGVGDPNKIFYHSLPNVIAILILSAKNVYFCLMWCLKILYLITFIKCKQSCTFICSTIQKCNQRY